MQPIAVIARAGDRGSHRANPHVGRCSLCDVTREKIALDVTLRELGDRISEHADQEPYDECFRDLNGQPMSDEQVLALARRIEHETGEQIVFEQLVD